MKIVDFVGPELIVPQLQAHEKSAVIRELADHLAAHVTGPQKIDREVLAKVLLERERLASTAIGEGVAIPHGKLDAVGRLVGTLGRARAGVEFESIDGKPTHLIFMLVAHANSTGVHLKALARLSRLFRDSAFRDRLMAAPDAPGMYQVIVEEDAKY